MKTRPSPVAPGGFTLLELVIALALSAVVMTAVIGLMLTGYNDRLRSSVRSSMTREGIAVSQRLTDDLRAAGLGVAEGSRLAGTERLYSGIIAGTNGANPSVGILGDIARPHATYNTFGLLDSRPPNTGFRRTLSWHNENNGACSPDSPGNAGCDPGVTSAWFPGGPRCNSLTAITCPWSMRRAEGGDELWVVDGLGTWEVGTLNGSTFGFRPFASVQLTADWNAAWPNTAPGEAPTGVGQGWVTTLDRVYWRLDGTVLSRNHCWGLGAGPTSTGWPAEATAAAPTNPTGTCTGWLPMLGDVSGLSFTFYDRLNNPLTLDAAGRKADVRRVEFRIQMSRTIKGQLVTHDVFGAAAIRN